MFRDVPRCSEMFRDVPRCSEMFRDVPRLNIDFLTFATLTFASNHPMASNGHGLDSGVPPSPGGPHISKHRCLGEHGAAEGILQDVSTAARSWYRSQTLGQSSLPNKKVWDSVGLWLDIRTSKGFQSIPRLFKRLLHLWHTRRPTGMFAA